MSLNRVFSVWILMEIMFLILVGLSLATSCKNVFRIIIFLVIQGIRSLFLIVLFLGNWRVAIWFAVAIKIGIFPFNMWFLRVISELDTLIILTITTLQKIPPILFIYLMPKLNLGLLLMVLVLNLFISGILAIWHSHLVKIIILGSIANNSWLIISGILSIKIILIYLAIYRIRIAPLLSEKQLHGKEWILILNLLFITGLPPFPIFYLKFLIVYLTCEIASLPFISMFLIRGLPLIMAQMGIITSRLSNKSCSPLIWAGH